MTFILMSQYQTKHKSSVVSIKYSTSKWTYSVMKLNISPVINTNIKTQALLFSWRLDASWFYTPGLSFKCHDDVIKWKHFPRNWPFVREIHRSPVNFPHKGQWRGALMFSLIYAWINDWVNNREAGDLRRQHGHYDVIVMCYIDITTYPWLNRYASLANIR